MEEDVKTLENLINQNKGAIKEAKASNDINSMNLIADMDSQNKALEHLLKAYKEEVLKQDKGCIPKSLFSEKIDELNRNLNTVEHYETVGAVQVLEEILKEGEK